MRVGRSSKRHVTEPERALDPLTAAVWEDGLPRTVSASLRIDAPRAAQAPAAPVAVPDAA